MGYRMTVCIGESRNIENPSPEDIDFTLDELRPMKNNFVILASDPRIENCDCIQTLIERNTDPDGVFKDDEIVYLVEVQFIYSKEFEKGKFNQYAFQTANVKQVKKMFRMFALGVVPDISSWKDITEEITAIIDKKEER